MTLRLAVVLLALASAGLTCPGPPGAPTPDTCAEPATDPLAALEVGTQATPFDPLTDGDVVDLEFGGQGGVMIVVRLRAAQAPECIALTATVDDNAGTYLVEDSRAVRTYEGADGRTTEPIYLVLAFEPDWGTAVRLRVTVGTTILERLLWVGQAGI